MNLYKIKRTDSVGIPAAKNSWRGGSTQQGVVAGAQGAIPPARW